MGAFEDILGKPEKEIELEKTDYKKPKKKPIQPPKNKFYGSKFKFHGPGIPVPIDDDEDDDENEELCLDEDDDENEELCLDEDDEDVWSNNINPHVHN